MLTVNGSDDGFDGFRIGLSGFDNPMRDAKTEDVKRHIGQVRWLDWQDRELIGRRWKVCSALKCNPLTFAETFAELECCCWCCSISWSVWPRAEITRGKEREEGEQDSTDWSAGQQTWEIFFLNCSCSQHWVQCSVQCQCVRPVSVSPDLIYRSDAGAGAVAFTQSVALLIIYEVSTLYITSLHSTTTPTPPADTTKGDTGCDQIPITTQSQYFSLDFWNSSQFNNMTALCKWRPQQYRSIRCVETISIYEDIPCLHTSLL